MNSEVKEFKEIETKLEELDIKILRKWYKNETRDLEILKGQEIELKAEKTKENRKEDIKILIDTKVTLI